MNKTRTAQAAFVSQAARVARAVEDEFGVPAAVTLAQAALESDWGRAHMGEANNYFGIKAYDRGGVPQIGPIAKGFVTLPTREVVNGRTITVNARFRSYASMADSFRVGGRQRIRDVYLPYLVPPMLAAARIGFSMSWKVVLLSEVFGFPGGLGFQIRINYTVYNLTALLAWLAIFVLALLVIEQGLRLTERRLVRWQPAH